MHLKRIVIAAASLSILLWGGKYGTAATLRPLVTEDANTLPGGQVDIKLSLEYINNYEELFTTNGDKGNLIELPRIGFNIGAADNVEIQVDWAALKLDSPLHDEFGPGDPRIFTKINIFKEDGNRPAFGMRFGIKVPSADDKKGLGTNETDIYAQALLSKTLGLVAGHLNLGVGILGDPRRNTGQDDLFTYAIGVIAPINEYFDVGGEVVGQLGSKTENERHLARFGARFNTGDLTFDASVAAGLNDQTEDYRVGAGLTYHWKAW